MESATSFVYVCFIPNLSFVYPSNSTTLIAIHHLLLWSPSITDDFSLCLQIIEMYKKIGLIKQKRRPLTKQERDEVFRLTEEQKRISDQLEAMKVPGPSFMD